MAVEVTSFVPGESGSWSPAEVLRVNTEEQTLLVQWLAEAAVPQNEVVPASRARPAPPNLGTAYDGWLGSLGEGDGVEMYYANAWWEVRITERHGGDRFTLLAPEYNKSHSRVAATLIRPRCLWRGWEAGWAFLQSGSQLPLGAPMPMMAHEIKLPQVFDFSTQTIHFSHMSHTPFPHISEI